MRNVIAQDVVPIRLEQFCLLSARPSFPRRGPVKGLLPDTSRRCPRHWKDRIPQGTILGPILFLIYVNDLPKCINATSLLFADDLKIFSDNVNLNLQTEINKLSDWSENWLLKFNPLKCKYMSYGNEMVLPLHINNSPIENTNQQKDLGIIFDSKLDFNQHIHE